MVEDTIASHSGELEHPKVVIASNGSVIARYHTDPEFRSSIDNADVIDADGMPLILVSRLICAQPLVERVATTDFVHDAADAASRSGVRFYLLGARPGVADEAAARLRRDHPGLQIVGTRHGYSIEENLEEICAEIVALKTDIVWLGLGSPYQENLAIRLRPLLPGVTWIRTCGGLFDHISGSVPRAPRWMQRLGLEWLHRAMKEPKRLGWRYIKTNPVAMFHLLTKTGDVEAPSSNMTVPSA